MLTNDQSQRQELAERMVSSPPFTWIMAGGDPKYIYIPDLEALKTLYKEWKALGGKPRFDV